MIVLRKTMQAAVEKEWQRHRADLERLVKAYGGALHQVAALQKQLSAWVMNESGNITPQQMAQMFYAQDSEWQAQFFNCMQEQVRAHHDALPPARPNELRFSPGVPAGEAQWWHMAKDLDESGFETIEAMLDHAKTHRDRKASPLKDEMMAQFDQTISALKDSAK